MTEERKEGKSPLARSLTRLLKESGLYTLVEWGNILGVRQSAISQWLHDKTLPRPEPLRMLRRVLEDHSDVPVNILAGFDELLNQPATEISPHGSKMGSTLAHYLLKPEWEAFERCVRPLLPEDQQEVLRAASAHAHRLAAHAEEVEATATQDGERQRASAAGGRLTLEDILSIKIEEQDPNPSIWALSGDRQQALIQPPMTLHLVQQNAQRFEAPSGLFATDEKQQSALQEDGVNFAAVPWVVPREEHLPYGFACDDMQLVIQQGAVEFSFEGGQSQKVVVSGKPHAPGLLRMIAPPNWEHGLPPLTVRTLSDEPALALAIFYARSGLNLNRVSVVSERVGRTLEVELETNKEWNEELVQRFWSESGVWKELLPLTGNILEEKEELERWVKENPLHPEDFKGKHSSARYAGQVEDCNWREWLKGAAVSNIDPEFGALHTRLLKFPAMPDLQEQAVCGDAHDGSEILIPLWGSFNYLYAQLDEAERDKKFENFGEFARSRERRGKSLKLWRGTASSANFSVNKLPDIVFVESSAYHGFHAVGGDTYCLHIRCLVANNSNSVPKNRRGARGASVSQPTRVAQRRTA